MTKLKSMTAVLLACAIIVPTSAQTIPDAAAWRGEPADKWAIDYADYQCVLRRNFLVEGKVAALSLTLNPVAKFAWLRLAIQGRGGSREDGDAIMIADGRRVDGTLHYNIYDLKGFRIREYSINFDGHPIGSLNQRLRLWTAKHGDVELDLGNFQPAWRAVRSCMDDLHKKFGITPEDISRVAKQPEGKSYNFYDARLLGGNADFDFIYWVSATGTVDSCTLLKPSGKRAFDKQLCGDMIKKARFKPALDAQGRPVRAPQFEPVSIRTEVVMTSSN